MLIGVFCQVNAYFYSLISQVNTILHCCANTIKIAIMKFMCIYWFCLCLVN